MSRDRLGKDVIIDYHGVRSTYRVPAAYPVLNLPMKYLGSYFNNDDSLSEPTSYNFAQFASTGTSDISNGHSLEVWAFRKEVQL